MARAKKQLVEATVEITEPSITIEVPEGQGTVSITQPEQVTTTHSLEKYLADITQELNKLDSVSAMVQAIMVKNRILTILNKIRAEL